MGTIVEMKGWLMRWAGCLGVLTALYSLPAAAATTGTGWVVGPNLVVTNHHVVGKATTVTLFRIDNRKLIADVVVRDHVNDVVLLRPRNPDLLPPALPIATRPAAVGSHIFTIGYPLVPVMGREPKLTTGYINSRTGVLGDPRTYQISAPIQPGNSGGPVFNMNGEVVGIATASLDAAKVFQWAGELPQNVNYAVKIIYVRALLDSVAETGKPVREVKRGPASLESLVARVRNSVLLVVAGNSPEEITSKNPGEPSPGSPPSPDTGEPRRVALYVYAAPLAYDLYDGYEYTLESYSANLAKLMSDYLDSESGHRLSVVHVVTANKKRLYAAYDNAHRKQECGQHKADFLIAAENQSMGGGDQEIGFYAFNCHNEAEHFYRQRIQMRRSDTFYYSTDLYHAMQNFTSRLPPQLKLSFRR